MKDECMCRDCKHYMAILDDGIPKDYCKLCNHKINVVTTCSEFEEETKENVEESAFERVWQHR